MSRWGFPTPPNGTSRVACAIPLPHMPLPIPRHGHRVHLSLSSPVMAAFPASTGRSARTSPFSRRAQRSLTLRPAYSPSHQVTLYTEGFSHFVTSMTAPVASGGSKIAGRDSHPQERRNLFMAHVEVGRASSQQDLHTQLFINAGRTKKPPSRGRLEHLYASLLKTNLRR